MNTDVLTLWVPGKPKTKGSLDFQPGRKCTCCAACQAYLPGGRAVENVAGSSRWRALMRYAVEAEMGRSAGDAGVVFPLTGKVGVGLVLALPVLNEIAPRAGDVDKLARNALDALQDAGVYKDDVQVTRLWTSKRSSFRGDVEGDEGPGAEITVVKAD